MKWNLAFLGFLLFFCLLIPLPVSAAEFVDEMDAVQNNPSQTYYNLAPCPAVGNWGELPDPSFLQFMAPTQGQGGVIYRINGGTQVLVSIYSSHGTTVSRSAQGTYLLGDPAITGGRPTSLQAEYDPTTGMVSLSAGKAAYSLEHQPETNYVFVPSVGDQPPSIPYGVTVWVSRDGEYYQRIPASRIKTISYPNSTLVQEEWKAAIPPEATFLKVEINDMVMLPASSGGMVQKPQEMRTMLSEVRIQGQNLVIGPQEEIKEETEPSSTSSKEESSSKRPVSKSGNSASKKKTTSSASSVAESSLASSAPSVAEPETKFVGTMSVSSPKPGKGGKGKSSSKATSTKVETTKKEEPPSQEESFSEQYYQEPPPAKVSGFSKGVTLYMLLIGLVILFLLLKPQDKEEEKSE